MNIQISLGALLGFMCCLAVAEVGGGPVYTNTGTWSNENGLSVQSGYEGYLVPAEPDPSPHSLLDALTTAGVLTALLPPLGKIGLKLGFLALNFLGLLLVGSVFTTAVCTFTPLCTISFLGLGFNRESVRSIVTQDNLLQASRFVTDAIEKFKAMQKKPKTKSD